MEINKQEMKDAFYSRNEERSQAKLIAMYYEMANYFVNKAKISSWHKEDYVQYAVARACRKEHLYDPNHINKEGKVSAVFSYFYKLIYMEIRYRMRETRQKKERRPGTCSYDKISAIVEDQHSADNITEINGENEDTFVMIDGRVYERNEVIEAMKTARKLLKKVKKDSTFIPEVDDKVVLNFYNKLKGIYDSTQV